jgi:hypothetical protein
LSGLNKFELKVRAATNPTPTSPTAMHVIWMGLSPCLARRAIKSAVSLFYVSSD